MRILLPAWLVLALLAPACRRASGEAGGGGRGAGGDHPVPVTTTKAARRDIPIWVEGLGTAAAVGTAVVRPQVDGRLEQLYFREGQAVRKGQLLAQIDPRPFLVQLHQAEGALARDQAQLLAARQSLTRNEELAKRQLIAPQQVDDQRALAGQAEGAVAIDRSQIESARLNLSYARITAPIDGVTGIRGVDPGNVVRASDPTGIVTLTQLDPVTVIFTLPQDDLPRVAHAMQEGALPVAVFSRDGAQELGRGALAVIDNQINAGSATLRLKALVPNPRHLLWPNQFVKARLLLSTRKDAVVVPAAALQRGAEGTLVYVVAADRTASARPVEVEQQQGDDALIARGVQPGDAVVIEGQAQLRAGSKVNAREAQPRPGGEGRP